MGATVEGVLSPDIAHLTRVVFTVYCETPDGKPERIDSQEAHLTNGKAAAVLTLWSPPFKDSEGDPVAQAEYLFKAKHKYGEEIASKRLTVKRRTHTRLSLKEIAFTGNNPVDNDTAGNFPAPEWKTGRAQDKQAPVAYVRNMKVALDATFAVDAAPSVGEAVEITGKAIFGSASLEWTGTVTVKPGDAEAKVSLESAKTLPDEVGCFEAVDIAWQSKPKGRPSASAGTSRNILYVTLGKPSGTPNYWTLLDISCKGAAGARDENALVKGCFQPFTRTLGDGKGFKRKRDGKELSYYKQGAGTPGSGVYTCADLLSRADGTARCGAWGEFLVAMHKVHGITSSQAIGMVPASASLLIVRNCAFPGSGSGIVPNTHKGMTECIKNDGIPGQGKDNPQFTFSDHALVRHSTGIYDPSYGVGPLRNLKAWEDAGVGGIGEPQPDMVRFTFRGDRHVLPGVCSPGYILYDVEADDDLADIAARCGIGSATALFNHPYNADLRSRRATAADVKAGDSIYIPREIAPTISIMVEM
jgi:hypothetical protein